MNEVLDRDINLIFPLTLSSEICCVCYCLKCVDFNRSFPSSFLSQYENESLRQATTSYENEPELDEGTRRGIYVKMNGFERKTRKWPI